MNIGRQIRNRSRGGMTRAERSADARRTRAHSHLQQIRGHVPLPRSSRRLYAALTAAAVAAGAVVGISLANSAEWGTAGEPGSIFVHGAARLSAAEVAGAGGLDGVAGGGAATPDALAERIAGHVWIADARALRLPNGDLLITVTETVPLAVAAAGEDDRDYVVDSRGVPFAPAGAEEARELVRVVVSDALVPSEPNKALAAAIELAAMLPAHGLDRPIEIAFAAGGDRAGYALRLEGLSPRVLLGDQELESKLQSLAEILVSDLPGLDDASELDLRFAGQAVLRTEPPHNGAAQAAATRGRAAPST